MRPFFTASSLTNLFALLTIAAGLVLERLGLPPGSLLLSMGLYAFSGSITNWLAVYMLFEKVPLLYGSGVIPARFEEFKASIHTLLMEQFFRADIMERLLGQTGQPDALTHVMRDAVNLDDVFDKLAEAILESSTFGGMLKMFGGVSALSSLREPVKEKMSVILDETLERMTEKAANSPDMLASLQHRARALIEARLEELTPQKVKELVQQMIQQHLGWLVVWGGALGAVLGAIAYGVQQVF
jgi:uncharacterized membrane protein YheB (UPF0754 family)